MDAPLKAVLARNLSFELTRSSHYCVSSFLLGANEYDYFKFELIIDIKGFWGFGVHR